MLLQNMDCEIQCVFEDINIIDAYGFGNGNSIYLKESKNITFDNIHAVNVTTNDGISSVLFAQLTDNIIIRNSKIENCTSNGSVSGFYIFTAKNFTLYNNIFTQNGGTPSTGAVFLKDLENSIIIKNTFIKNNGITGAM